jgi:cytochrome c-type biogenesis protein CcmE
MKNNYIKFGALIVVILGTLTWLAVGGVSDGGAYYKTVPELQAMGDAAQTKRIRVGGDVEPGSIVREGAQVKFTLKQEDPAQKTVSKLNVLYTGIDPLPDTFKDGSQALADGKLGADGVFHAQKIQAKCASKYEAKPPASKSDYGKPSV